MADDSKRRAADMAADTPGFDAATGGTLPDILWDIEDAYWQSAYPERPYARADRGYAYYREAYWFGAAAAFHHRGRGWHDVAAELRAAWMAQHDAGTDPWEDMRHAVRDAWDHVRGRSRDDRTHIR